MINFNKQPISSGRIKKALKNTRVKTGLEKYVFIMKSLKKVDASKDFSFQKIYKGFYRVRRNDDFCKYYFSLMEIYKESKTTPVFSELLKLFFVKFQKLEASFISKMLATIDDNLPVYDRNVLAILQIKKPNNLLSANDRYIKICDIYSMLRQWYSYFIPSEEGKKWLNLFNGEFPNSGISSVKKIDLILWALYG